MVDVSAALATELIKTLDTVPEALAESSEVAAVPEKKKSKPKRFRFSDKDVLFHEELLIVEGYRVPNPLFHFASISHNPKRIKFNGVIAPELLTQISSPVLSSTDSSEFLKSIKTPPEPEAEKVGEDVKVAAAIDRSDEPSESLGSRRPSSASVASTASKVTIVTRKLTGTSECSDGSQLDRTSSSSSLETGVPGLEKMGDIVDRLFAMSLRTRRVGSELKLKHVPKSEPSLIWRVLGIARIRVKDVKEDS